MVLCNLIVHIEQECTCSKFCFLCYLKNMTHTHVTFETNTSSLLLITKALALIFISKN